MMRTVAVSVALSFLMSIAASALYLRAELDGAMEDGRMVGLLRVEVAELREKVDLLSNSAVQVFEAVANAPNASSIAAEVVAPVSSRVDGMRAELDAMQTEIRILKLSR